MGFWSDLLSQGGQAIKSEAAKRQSSQGQSAHINAQNEVVQEFGTIVGQYHAGQFSNAGAQQKIQAAANSFASYCQSLGYSRALAGAADVNGLARQVLLDLQREAGTGIIGSITGAIPGALGASLGGLSTPTLLMLGVGAYLLIRKK